MNIRNPLQLGLCCLLFSCASQPTVDPLQNTKKLVAEGHATLYHNGAFEVPMTTIHLIPPGPDALDLALELAGVRASQSFQESLKHARESADFAKAGVQKSLAAGGAVIEVTDAVAREARTLTASGGQMVASAPSTTRSLVSASVSYAGATHASVHESGAELAADSLSAGKQLNRATDSASSALLTGSVDLARDTSQAARVSSRKHAEFAGERFIMGYATLPSKLAARAGKVAKSGSIDHFVNAFRSSNEWRASASAATTDIVVDTRNHYANDVKRSFGAAASEITKGADTGYTFAVLKSLRWVLQGLFWDATVKPVGKLTAASLGYIAVNAVAFPALVTVREGVVVADIAVEVAWNSVGSVYDVTAPTATAAVVGVFSAVELIGGQAVAGGELVGGTAASVGVYGVGKTIAATTAAGGFATGKTVQYVGAPLSAAGVAMGGTAVGVVAGATSAIAGTGAVIGGVGGEAATRVIGTTAAAAVVGGGSAVSVSAGAALGTYELAKVVVVPAGYELGAGIVLSYGTLSQLSAQTVLAVSDASYMVLSLEGPRWVLYAVKGNLDRGENLPTGAVLDLEKMQQAGETLYQVPVSDQNMKGLVDTVYGELPVNTIQGAAVPD